MTPTEQDTQESTDHLKEQRLSFARDTSLLAGSAVLAQMVSFFLAPVLSRIYSPAAYGGLALFTATARILAEIGCLRYQHAILLPEKQEDARAILIGAVGVLAAFTGICLLLLYSFSPILVNLWDWGDAQDLVLWIPAWVFISGLMSVLDNWLTRNTRYARKSVQRVSTSLTDGFSKLGFGLAGLATTGFLIASTFIGFGAGFLVQIFGLKPKRFNRRSPSSHSPIWNQLKKYKKFATVDTWTSLLNVVSHNVSAILLAVFFSSSVVGQYSRGGVLLQLPMTLIGDALGQVFYQRAILEKASGTLSTFTRKIVVFLLSAGTLPFLVLAISGREILIVFFGENWELAGSFCQSLSLWCLLVFISRPISTLLFVYEKQEINLLWNVVNTIFTALALILGSKTGNPIVAVAFYSLSSALSRLALLAYLFRLVDLKLREAMYDLKPVATSLLAFALPLLAVKVITDPEPLFVVILSLVAMLGHFVLLVRVQPYASELFRLIVARIMPLLGSGDVKNPRP